MNRLSPLIVRRPREAVAIAATMPREVYPTPFEEVSAAIPEDVKAFATAFLGGLVFFGTLVA